VDYHRGPVLTLLALGVRLSAPEYVPGNTWGDRLEGGFGVSARGLAGLSFGVELLASGSFVRQSWPDGDVPMELLGTASVDLPAGFALRAAAGGGLTHGLGSPSSRGLVVLDWRWPGLSDGDGDGVPDAFDRCPDVPEDRDGIDDADGCPEADADGDGIPDERDACPTQAEIFNGLLDDDGCPDRATQVDVLILTDEGSEIEVAQVAMAEEEPVGCLVERPCSFVVADGPNSLRVTADGYHPVEQTVQADGGQQDVVVRLVPVVYGGLLVRIVDETGAPLVGWTRIGGRTEVVDAGGRRFKLPVGTVEITALARGHDPRRMEVAVPVGTELEAVVQLAPTALVRDGARIVPRSTVFFALNSDVVAPEAEPDLDALAALLLSDPGLRLLRVEGHADERGNSVYNLDLSRRRASAVVDAIVARGVARERLEALGSGESRQAGAARSVDFLLLVWDETPAPD
jgi:outer membrane protein OmpA-like peptidoglycan-associated protein